jgi:hypothetical protein
MHQRPAESIERGRDATFWCTPKLAAGMGRIWIYRTAPKGIGVPPTIVIDGRQYEPLLHGTAYSINVVPGKHQVTLAYHEEKLEVEVAAGDDAFVRFDLDPALFGRGFFPVLVERETAQVEVNAHTGTDFGCIKD